MELLITFFLLGLLSVAVCNLFKAKAKTTVIVTIIVLIAYIVVIFFTCDLSALVKTFLTWLDGVGKQFIESVQ